MYDNIHHTHTSRRKVQQRTTTPGGAAGNEQQHRVGRQVHARDKQTKQTWNSSTTMCLKRRWYFLSTSG